MENPTLEDLIIYILKRHELEGTLKEVETITLKQIEDVRDIFEKEYDIYIPIGMSAVEEVIQNAPIIINFSFNKFVIRADREHMLEYINSNDIRLNRKTFNDIKEGDIIYITEELDTVIHECPVLHIQKPAVLAYEDVDDDKVSERNIFAEFKGMWIELEFSNWDSVKYACSHEFNHIKVFTDKLSAIGFMKQYIENTIKEMDKDNKNSQEELKKTIADKDKLIVHWEDRIRKTNENLKKYKKALSKL